MTFPITTTFSHDSFGPAALARLERRAVANGGLFKHETKITRSGRPYLVLTEGSGGAECLTHTAAMWKRRLTQGRAQPHACAADTRTAAWYSCRAGQYEPTAAVGFASCKAPVSRCAP